MPDRKLQLREALDILVVDGLVDRAQADHYLLRAGGKQIELHLLVVVADQRWDG